MAAFRYSDIRSAMDYLLLQATVDNRREIKPIKKTTIRYSLIFWLFTTT